jgi:hypothetical protein
MSPSRILFLAFAISLSCLPHANATDRLVGSPHSHRGIHHVRHRAPATHEASAPGMAAEDAPVITRPAVRPLVRDDSDGLSRDPKDCNMGCLDSSP